MKRSTQRLALAFAALVVLGFTDATSESRPLISLALRLSIWLLIYFWLREDARERGMAGKEPSGFSYFVLAPIAVLASLVETRGWARGALWFLGLVVALFIAGALARDLGVLLS